MKKWSIESLSLAGLILVLLLLATFTWLSMQRLADAAAEQRGVRQLHDSLVELAAMRADLDRADLSQYRLQGGDTDALSERDASLNSVRGRADAIDTLFGADPAARAHLQELRASLQAAIGKAAMHAGRWQRPAQANGLIAQLTRQQQQALSRVWDEAEQRHAGSWRALALRSLAVAALCALVLLLIRRLALANKTARGQLQDSEGRYRALVDIAHEGIWLIDQAGRSIFANASVASMFGCSLADLLERPAHSYFGECGQATLAAIFASAGAARDLCYRRDDGSSGWALVRGRLLDDKGAQGGLLLLLTDISERKRIEQNLASAHARQHSRILERTAELMEANARLCAEIIVRKAAEQAKADSEERLNALITTIPVAFFVKDAQSRLVMMNAETEQQWGLRFEQVGGTDGSAFFPPEQMSRFLADDRAVFASRKVMIKEEQVWNSRLRETRMMQTIKKPLYDAAGEPSSLLGICLDITQRKQDEEALRQAYLQLRQLREHQETIREEERRRIALEIHDELGQNLMALKIDVSMLHGRTGASHPRLNEKVARVLGTIDTSIRSVRAIINELHPSTLELGLCAALEWQLTQFERRSGIVCKIAVEGEPCELDKRATAALFRIVQESLGNIVRHAQASRVQLTVRFEPDSLSLLIDDDGIGMLSDAGDKPAGFGLPSIRERLAAFGGKLIISSGRGNGTAVSILLPLHSDAEIENILI